MCIPKTQHRELLVGKELFARLEGRRGAPTDPWEAVASELLHGGGVGAEAACTRWWHLGGVSLSPFKVAAREMRFVAEPSPHVPDGVDLEARVGSQL